MASEAGEEGGLGMGEHKWTVSKNHTDWQCSRTPGIWFHFSTHRKAFDYAFKEATRELSDR